MGVLFDYFAAASDDLAATAIEAGPVAVPLPALQAKGIDPIINVGTLESLLTGVDYDTVTTDPRWGKDLAMLDDGERLVISLTAGVQAALAGADEARLREVAGPWSHTEELEGWSDASDLAEVLLELATLAREATERGDQLYCWVCV
ncbi:hypothetical protein BLA60_09515 [Actinophytocola xinjiangensis]|uniref:DUF1877 family protein n=1 Tax=Actinophytocola xinjiangensis TaxID=485602 RepID=A0A7Z1AZL6_9PSEU|nr:hypothetical protein [Actinophytocola xinjiangensis]OLF12218.1 hypothetical protein BLA60_09515 [Actinophytocola xinjiangensis]